MADESTSLAKLLQVIYDSRQHAIGRRVNRVIQLTLQPRDGMMLADGISAQLQTAWFWDGAKQWDNSQQWSPTPIVT